MRDRDERRRLDEQIAAAERDLASGAAGPAGGLRLGQLYLRAGRPADARRVLEAARDALPALVEARPGEAELLGVRAEVDDLLQVAEREAVVAGRAARRRELLERLERGALDRALHDELIRLEVQDGLPVHPERPACPACGGGLAEGPHGLVCARSGAEGDLCRHVDARGLLACPGCGLVVRVWTKGRLRPDPHEPPLARLERSRCGHCGGRVASWRQHLLSCPRARAADFPRCERCGQRGHHTRRVRCPRCPGQVAELPCAE